MTKQLTNDEKKRVIDELTNLSYFGDLTRKEQELLDKTKIDYDKSLGIKSVKASKGGNYKRGANFERRVMKWYESHGFDVIRSAGSHGRIDILAVLGGVWIANTLRLSNYWSPIEREQFESWCKRNWCKGRYVWRDSANKIQFKEVE